MRHTFGLNHHALAQKLSSILLLLFSGFVSQVFAQTETAPPVVAASSVAISSAARVQVEASLAINKQSASSVASIERPVSSVSSATHSSSSLPAAIGSSSVSSTVATSSVVNSSVAASIPSVASVSTNPTDSTLPNIASSHVVVNEAAALAEMMSPSKFIMDTEIKPGTSARLTWSSDTVVGAFSEATPIIVVNGATPGKTLCLTAAVHGDELNGIEMVRRVIFNIDPAKLTGTIIGVPVANIMGFRRNSRYLPDRRDWNRYFLSLIHI